MRYIFLVSILLSLAANAAQPDVFDASEMSSEVIFATVGICTDKMRASISPAEKAITYCACVTDAIRVNSKSGQRPPNNNATDEQKTLCRAEKGFFQVQFNSRAVFRDVAACVARALQANATELDAVVGCACIEDAVRVNFKSGRPVAPTPEQLNQCHKAFEERFHRPDGGKATGKVGI